MNSVAEMQIAVYAENSMTSLTEAEIAKIEGDIVKRAASTWTADDDELIANWILGTRRNLRRIEYRLRYPVSVEITRGRWVKPPPVPAGMEEDILHAWIVRHLLEKRDFDPAEMEIAFWPYLFRSIAVFAIGFFRRKDEQPKRPVGIPDQDDARSSPDYEPIDTSCDFRLEVEKSEIFVKVLEVIEESTQLDEIDRSILLLHYFRDMSHEEIAVKLTPLSESIRKRTSGPLTSEFVRKRKGRALKTLRAGLASQGISVKKFEK